MQFMGSLYVGETLAAREYEIVRKVHNSKKVPNLYLITFSDNPDNMLDLIPQKDVLQTHYPTADLRVVGIAAGKAEAIELLQRMITDALAKAGSSDVRIYLKQKWEEQACR